MTLMLVSYLPIVILLAAGYSMARWVGLKGTGLYDLLRFVLLPVYLCHALLGTLQREPVVWIVALGALVALVGGVIVSSVAQSLKQSLDRSSTVANIALFALPVLSIAWNLKQNLQMSLALLFIGTAVVHILLREKQRGLATLVRQPWLYGVVAAGLVHYGIIERGDLLRATRPLGSAAEALALIYLGTLLTAVGGLQRRDLWLAIVTRLGVGFVVALIVTKIAPIPGALQTTLIAGCMAPPATLSTAVIRGKSGDGRGGQDAQIIAAGILVALIAYFLFPSYIAHVL